MLIRKEQCGSIPMYLGIAVDQTHVSSGHENAAWE